MIATAPLPGSQLVLRQLLIPNVGGKVVGKLIVDLFCCAGGASQGLERALGRSPDIAINHDPLAVELHSRNHPATEHFRSDVFEVDPRTATGGRPVGWLHASPDCTYFSKANGGRPLDRTQRRIRSLAWIVVRWAALVRPDVISLENVEEFLSFGPVRRGRPVAKRKGAYFDQFVEQLRSLGYVVEWRIIQACDHGAATTRPRLYLLARCDGHPVVWPAATHGPGRAQPHRTAAEIIDWSLPCRSIFGRKRSLAEASCARIAKGLVRYILKDPHPFLAPVGAAVGPVAGEGTVSAFIAKHYGGVVGHRPDRPLGTITCRDHHAVVQVALQQADLPADGRTQVVAAFLTKYYKSGSTAQSLREPLHTIMTRARFGLVLVTIDRTTYRVVDIGMRMITKDELAAAQGFSPGYVLPASQKEAIYFIGHSVCPDVLCALARANMPTALTSAA